MKNLFLFFISISILLSACEDGQQGVGTEDAFDRSTYLEYYAENIIQPAYNSYDSKLNSLVSDLSVQFENFDIEAARGSFKSAYIDWQKAALYNFGPALENNILAQTNTFPTDTAKINSNVSAGIYKLSSVSNYDAKGFPALDYLLFNEETLTENELNHALSIAQDMKAISAKVVNKWNGDYYNTFIERDGNDVGSSLGIMLNAFNMYLERDFRNGKLAIPLGFKTGGTPMPGKAEAYYSGFSNDLLQEGAKAIRTFYLASELDNTGKGLYGMLSDIGDRYQSGNLPDEILQATSELISNSENLSSDIGYLSTKNDPLLNDTYTSAKKLVVHFKSNIPSALGIMITYQDNDGD
jgi:predicted lipoprotein